MGLFDGKPLDPKEIDPMAPLPDADLSEPNPMVRAFGPGPEGAICRECVHLEVFQQANRWYKCDLRTPGGPATDHRMRWRACAKYEKSALRSPE